MGEPGRTTCWNAMAERTRDVVLFVAVSEYYAHNIASGYAMLRANNAIGFALFTDRFVSSLYPDIGMGVIARMNRELKDKEFASLGALKTVDRGDIGMVQDGKELSLPFEPGHSLLVLGEGGRKNLYGDVAAKVLVNSPIDLAHPARAYLSEDFIAAGVNSSWGNKADRRLEGFGE
jgi:hypothetical protein